MHQSVLVTGATGVIGSRLIRWLRENACRIRILSRRCPTKVVFPFPVEWMQGDITNRAVIRQAVQNIDTVFHLAAKLHINMPPDALKGEYERVNVRGTGVLADAARAAGVKRVVFFSTINVYGRNDGNSLLHESSAADPLTVYARTKLKAEQVVLSGATGVVLRLAAVYGPGMKGNYPCLLQALEKGLFLMPGDGNNRRTLVHVDDVCRAALLAATHPLAPGQVFNVTDGRTHTLNEIVGAMCMALGRSYPRYHIPESSVRFVLRGWKFIETCAHCRLPLGSDAVAKLLEDAAVEGEKIRTMLGFAPQYDLVHGWHDCVQRMRENEANHRTHDRFTL